jgi:hypothetical protein
MKGAIAMQQLADISDEALLNLHKSGENDFFTLAEAHKTLAAARVKSGIGDIRGRIQALHRDGYLGNEPTGDGVNMYFVVYCPEC